MSYLFLNTLLHDAKKGFHDIKGLNPEIEKEYYYFDKILIALIITALIFSIYSFFKKKRKYANLPANQRAKKILTDILKDLKNKKISIREYSSQSSVTLRDYISDSYNFNATELTNTEVLAKLKKIKIDQEMFKNIKIVLKNFDKVTFSDVEYSNLEEFEKLTKTSQNLVNTINDI